MKINWSKAALIGVGIGFTLLHYAAFTVSYVRSEVIGQAQDRLGWQVASQVLSFPLGYLANVSSVPNLFLVGIVANSILWGVGCAAIVRLFMLRRRAAGGATDPM